MEQSPTPHNLGLYLLNGFSGSRRLLLLLHDWMTGGDDLPAMAISGEQGNGKSTLATAAAWNHFYTFTDGIIRVSPAGTNPFRLYDVVRTLDTVLGTALTRTSDDRWGISILEQLYKRRRLLVLDKLAGATPKEINTLVEVIGHLHENQGQSRILLIDRNFSAAIASLVQYQHIHLAGLDRSDTPEFIHKRAPSSVRSQALQLVEAIYAITGGSPLSMRFVMGLLLDYPWDELEVVLRELESGNGGNVTARSLCSFAVENYALQSPAAAVLLSRLVHAVGGVSLAALRDLFWNDLGSPAQMDETLQGLAQRSLLELDPYRDRAFIHPVVRRYLDEHAAMLGEEWDRRHAAFFVSQAEQFQRLPLVRWPEIDRDWGNIFVGADWCARRVERIWERSALDMIADPSLDVSDIAEHPEIAPATGDLRLARNYALALAEYAFWRHPPGSIRWLAVGAIAALALQDIRNYGWFLMNIGRQLFFMGRLQEAIEWLERARPIFDQRDLLSELAYVYTDLGTTYRVLDEPRRALDHFLVAFDCIAQIGDQHGLATAYMNLGSAYFSLNQHERALAEHAKALRVALRTQDKHLIASVYNNVGLAMEATERFEDAAACLRNCPAHSFAKSTIRPASAPATTTLAQSAMPRSDFAQALRGTNGPQST